MPINLTVAGLGINRLRDENRAAIGKFVEDNKKYLIGRVLDFGCGVQPYRGLVNGEYVPYDPGYSNASPPPIPGQFDAIIVTQVLQFTENPSETLRKLREHLLLGGHFVITYHSSWYEIQEQDTWRITKRGMERIIGCNIVKHVPVSTIEFDDFKLCLTYGIVAQKP